MSDTLVIGGTTYSNVEGFKATDSNSNTVTFIKPSGTKSISANGTVDVTEYASASVSVPNTYAAGDEGKVVSNGALVSQSSATYNSNATYDTTLINSVTVQVPTGSALTTVASGTFTGNGTYDLPVNIGKKMPKTDFWVKFTAKSTTQFAYDTSYKPAVVIAVVYSSMGHLDLSAVGDGKSVISDQSFSVNNNGTVTSIASGSYVGQMTQIRNGSASYGRPNNFKINRKSDHFEVRLYNSNQSNAYPTGITYDYEVVYFGTNAATDIVEIA